MHQSDLIPFTKSGFEELKKEREVLAVKRQETIKSLQRAREMGDLSENALYKAAKIELGSIDRRLRRSEYLIKHAKIVETENKDVVDIDTKVVVDDGNKTRELSIVGGYESNPLEGKISHISPIGKALMGKRVGDEILVETPKGKVRYKIVEIK